VTAASGVTSRRRVVARVLGAVLVVLVIAAAAAAPHAGTALVVSAPGPAPDAIVSLASHEWERLPALVEQAGKYPDALIVLTVPQEVTQYNCHDCAHRSQQLIGAGVDASRIRLIPLTSGGTYGEALATKRFIENHGLAHVLVVTSPYHTRRSLETFRAIFRDTPVTVGIMPASATSPARPERWWATPYDRWYVRYEWAAILYYYLRHGVPPQGSDS
jgi:uncharacterized SAM-binding protein YcdF (DUF218 family)